LIKVTTKRQKQKQGKEKKREKKKIVRYKTQVTAVLPLLLGHIPVN